MKEFCLWFTGLPCSGKSTLAKKIKEKLEEIGKKTYILDGDIIRKELNVDLGFSEEDRRENIRRVSVVAKILTECGVVPIVALVSPFRDAREKAREKIEKFVEIYVKAPIEICMQRDVKGMYKMAIEGKIKGFTGIDDPYEEPLNPEVVCETDKESIEECVEKILNFLENKGYIKRGYTEEEEEIVKKRLEELGYI
ncbi:MAG: adenylyl-sulfate kinase [candidate division WOR-3 bacterium]